VTLDEKQIKFLKDHSILQKLQRQRVTFLAHAAQNEKRPAFQIDHQSLLQGAICSTIK